MLQGYTFNFDSDHTNTRDEQLPSVAPKTPIPPPVKNDVNDNGNDNIKMLTQSVSDLRSNLDHTMTALATLQGHVLESKNDKEADIIATRDYASSLFTRNIPRSTSVLYLTARFSGTGAIGTPLELAQQSAATNDVLTWNGTSWAPAAGNSGTVALNAGSVGSPSLYFTGYSTTGFYRSAANLIDVSVSGVQCAEYSSTGFYVLKQLGVGVTSTTKSSFTQFSAPTTAAIGNYVTGTVQTTTSLVGANDQAGRYIDATLKPSGTTTNCFAELIAPTFDASLATATTIPSAFGMYLTAGSLASGTVTNGYSLYVNNPGFGTNKCALYTDNLSIGYTATAPPTNGAIITGQTVIGANAATANERFASTLASTDLYAISARGTTTASSSSNAFYAAAVFNPTNGTTTEAGYQAICSYIAPNTMTITNAVGFYVNSTVSANVGTITNLFGVYADTGSAGAGTITNAYGGYFKAPSAGTNKCAVYTDNLSIGYTATAPPTNGAIITGQTVVGASSATANYRFTVTAAAADVSIIAATGTTTSSPSINSGIYCNAIFNPTTGNTTGAFAVNSSPTFIAPTSQTIAYAACMYTKPTVSSNVGTITNLAGLICDTVSATTGTITNVYGALIFTPTSGTNKIALYADNMSIGYLTTTPPTNGLIVTGQTVVGASSATANCRMTVTAASTDTRTIFVSGQTTSGTNPIIGIYVNSRFSPTNGNSQSYGISASPLFSPPSGKTTTTAACIYTNPDLSQNGGTVTNVYGILCDVGNTGGGTITNVYGLYVKIPGIGTNRYCAYFDGGVGIGVTAPTSAGLTLPTTAGTAATLDSYELLDNSGTWASNAGGGTPSSTVHVYTYKIGKIITILAQAFTCVTPAGADILKFSVTLPARFRPSVAAYMCCSRIVDNSVNLTTPGELAIDTAGGVYLTKDSAGASFTALSTCGLGGGCALSYNLG